MKRKAIIPILILAAAIFLLFRSQPITTADTSFGVVLDATTGEVLYDQNKDHTAQPASLVKLMTSLLLLEQLQPSDTIPITQNALDTEEHTKKIALRAGELLTRDEALKLMLVISVDPVAEAVAERIAGSRKEFVSLMNERAKELGVTHPVFQNASGAEASKQLLSAYDIALVARELIQHPEALKAMQTVTAAIHTSQQETTVTNNGRKAGLANSYAIASKSGRTNIGGHTLAAIYERDGKAVISVVLQSDEEHVYEAAAKMAQQALKEEKD